MKNCTAAGRWEKSTASRWRCSIITTTRSNSAAALLRRLLSENVDNYELHFYLGLVFSSRDSLALARLEFEKTLDLRNTFEDAWRQICSITLRQRLMDEALAVARRYTETLSMSSTAWRTLGPCTTCARNTSRRFPRSKKPLP